MRVTLPIAMTLICLFGQACTSQPVRSGASAAELNKTRYELASCSLQVRVIERPDDQTGPRFIMINGVPLSSAIYRNVAERLQVTLSATSYLVDLPGTGGSTLKGDVYSWPAIRECIHSYLGEQPPHILIMDDISPLAALPLPKRLSNSRGLVILNAVIKPSQVSPPFPLNFLRCFPDLGVAVGSITPRAFYLARIRALGISRPDAVSDEALGSLYAEMRGDGGLRNLARLLSGFALDGETDQDIANGLKAPIPQLFLWGTADPVLGNEYKHLLPLSEHQQLVTFPEARHFLMLDYPNEIVAAISDWYTIHAPFNLTRPEF